jgi:hypothetical protein
MTLRDYSMSRELRYVVHVILHNASLSLNRSFLSLMNHHMRCKKASLKIPSHLVLASSSLARFELVKVPAANSQVALVLVHAAPEVGNILCANAGSLEVGVHGGLAVLVLRKRLVDRRSSRAGSAAEPATDGVADRGTDSDTAR